MLGRARAPRYLPSRLPSGGRLVALLRDPVARAFSKCGDSGLDSTASSRAFAACVLSPRNLNYQSAHVAACAPGWRAADATHGGPNNSPLPARQLPSLAPPTSAESDAQRQVPDAALALPPCEAAAALPHRFHPFWRDTAPRRQRHTKRAAGNSSAESGEAATALASPPTTAWADLASEGELVALFNSTALLAAALTRLNRFEVVLVTERLDEAGPVFRHYLGWGDGVSTGMESATRGATAGNANASAHRAGTRQPTAARVEAHAELAAEARAANANDAALYAYAAWRFERHLEAAHAAAGSGLPTRAELELKHNRRRRGKVQGAAARRAGG